MDPFYREAENVMPSVHIYIVFFVKYKLGKLERLPQILINYYKHVNCEEVLHSRVSCSNAVSAVMFGHYFLKLH